MRFRRQPRAVSSSDRRARCESGYILLILLIMLALIVITMAAAAPRLAQQIKREREIEMIHRGEQYARAIKKYYKKFGRYPARIEDLENTNNLRFLRKRYKDPINKEGNWRLVRFGEVQLGQGGGLPGQTGNSGQGGGQGGGTSGGTSGGAQGGSGTSGGTSGGQGGGTTGGNTGGGSSSLFSQPLGGQQFGGGPILGVASQSDKTGIHEFDNKRKYNQWLFVYDPTMDRGGLIKGPYNPKAFVGNAGGGIPPPGGPAQGGPPGGPPPSGGPPPGGNPLQ